MNIFKKGNTIFKLLLFVVVLIGLVGCASGAGKTDSKPSTDNSPITNTPSNSKPVETHTAAPDAILQISNIQNISADLKENPINIKVSNGSLISATIDGDDANRAILNKNNNVTEWNYSGFLTPGNNYTMKITYENNDKIQKTDSFTVNTVSVDNQTIRYTLFPYDGKDYGVGMPVTVQFSSPVTNKSEIESHLHVKSDPDTKGSWGWIDNTRAVWRPDEYWKPQTKVEATVDLEGVHLTDNTYGAYNIDGKFNIGRSMILNISNDTKQMTVVQDGNTVKTMPVSLGKPGYDTVNGTHIIYEKQPVVRMVDYDYDEDVYLDQRLTSSGFYIHSAPWSVAQQGYTNVSHGCVNISPENAQWLYDNSLLGDVVNISGTNRTPELWDGMGAIWNLSASDWHKYSANS